MQGRSVQLVVVDNASQDGSYEAVREVYPQAVAIRNATNLGFGAACNQAIASTTARFILLLNSDARLTAKALETLCECMQQNERCGAAGPRIIDSKGAEAANTRNFLTAVNQAFEVAGIGFGLSLFRRTRRPEPNGGRPDCSVDWIDGACLMLRRAALDEVGLFDERFFMYSEDEDLCFRLRDRGWLVCHCGDGTVVHYGGASSRLNKIEMLYHFYRSQMLFLSKHRGNSSASFFVLAMKVVLGLKRLLVLDVERRETAGQHLIALKEACVARKRNQ
jgi:GT2 family glycosyltransferase